MGALEDCAADQGFNPRAPTHVQGQDGTGVPHQDGE